MKKYHLVITGIDTDTGRSEVLSDEEMKSIQFLGETTDGQLCEIIVNTSLMDIANMFMNSDKVMPAVMLASAASIRKKMRSMLDP